MTDEEKREHNDIVATLMAQRNAAQNEAAQAIVALRKAERMIEELRAKVEPQEEKPKTNGELRPGNQWGATGPA